MGSKPGGHWAATSWYLRALQSLGIIGQWLPGIWEPCRAWSSSGSDPFAPVGPGVLHSPSTFLLLASAMTSQSQGVWEPLSSARAVRNWGKASPADTFSLPLTGRAGSSLT